MAGKLIVCEGLDCSGKTTAIEEIINSNPEYVYSKGIGSNSGFGRVARRFPSTFMFISELVYNTYANIIPNLGKNKIILQDRYDISVISFVPNTKKWYNKLLIYVSRLLIPRPDAIVYFYLPIKQRIKRLIAKGKKYESMLAENSDIIELRESEYKKWYEQFNGPKIRINTQDNNIRQTARILRDFVQNL